MTNHGSLRIFGAARKRRTALLAGAATLALVIGVPALALTPGPETTNNVLVAPTAPPDVPDGSGNIAINPNYEIGSDGTTQVDGGPATLMGVNNSTWGGSAMAIGVMNMAGNPTPTSSYDSFAIGAYNVSAGGALSLGAWNKAQASGSVAEGYYNVAPGAQSVAIGYGNNATLAINALGEKVIVAGSGGAVPGPESVAIGTGNFATGGYSIAIGTQSNALTTNSIAIGAGANALGASVTELTPLLTASGNPALPYYVSMSNPSGLVTSTVVGANSWAVGKASTAFGSQDYSVGLNSTTVGAANFAYFAQGVAIGFQNQSLGIGAIAIGAGNISSADNATTIGVGNTNQAGFGSGVFGLNNITDHYGVRDYAIGNNNNVQGNDNFVFGENVQTGNVLNNSVWLGNNSTAYISGAQTTGMSGNSSQVINGQTLNFAGGSPSGLVSIGAVGTERVLQNVSAGLISPTSTDAINGSQLYAVASSISTAGGSSTWKLSDGATTSTVNSGDTVTIKAGASGNETATLAGQTLTVDISKTPTFDSVSLTTGQKLSSTGLDLATTKVVNMTAGTNATDGVNVSQLTSLGNSTASALGGGAAYNAATDTISSPSFSVYGASQSSVAAAVKNLQDKAPIQFSNASGTATPEVPSNNETLVGASPGTVTLHNVAPGVAQTDAVNVSQLQSTVFGAVGFSATGNDNTAGSIFIGVHGTLGVVGGASTPGTFSDANIKTATTSNGKLDVQISNSPKFGNVTVNANGSGQISGVTAGSNATDAVNVSQLTSLGNSTASAIGGGSTYDPTKNSVSAPSFAVYGTTQNSVAKAVIALQDLAPLQYSDANGVPTPQTPSNDVTLVGASKGAPVTVHNVAAGVAGTDAVDVAQLQSTVFGAVGFSVSANDNSAGSIQVGAHGTFGIVGGAATAGTYSDANIKTATTSTGSVDIQMSNQPTFGAVTINSGDTGRISGVSNGVLASDAVNVSQLSSLGSSTANALGGGSTYNAKSNSISAPSYSVYGTVQDSVSSTVNALQNLAPVQYSDAKGNPTPQTPSNDVAFVGISGPVVVHNVAAGVAATDAVDVAQLPGAWSTPKSNTFVLSNVLAPGQVKVTNLAPGTLSATSTDSVNGSQLYGTNQSLNNLANATQQALSDVNQKVDANRKLSSAGIAGATALGMVRYDDRPGKFSMGIAAGGFDGQGATAIGAGFTSQSQLWRFSAGVHFAPTYMKSGAGFGVSTSYTFN